MINKTFAAGFALVVIGEIASVIPEIFLWKDWPNLIRATFVRLPPFITFGFLSGVLADWFFAQQNMAIETFALVLIWIIVKFSEYTLEYSASFLRPIFENGNLQQLRNCATLIYTFALALSLAPFICFRDVHGISYRITIISCALLWLGVSALFHWTAGLIAKNCQDVVEVHCTKIIRACHIGNIVNHEIIDDFNIARLDHADVKALKEWVEKSHISINNVNSSQLLKTLSSSSGTFLTSKQLKEATYKAQKSVLRRLEIIRAMCWVVSGNEMQANEGIALLKKSGIGECDILQQQRHQNHPGAKIKSTLH